MGDRCAQRPAGDLPFGIQKRVEFARALAADPKLLLLDEPAAGLNHEELDGLGDLIKDVRDRLNITVLLYFVTMTAGYIALFISAVVGVIHVRRELEGSSPESVSARGRATLPITILCPAHNEEATVVESVRALLAHAREHGAGQRYLIQHSAGSGKSNSIAWLAHQLTGLEHGGGVLFDSIIVVTDRRNLDTQINQTIRQFMQVGSTVGHAETCSTPGRSTLSGFSTCSRPSYGESTAAAPPRTTPRPCAASRNTATPNTLIAIV